MDSGDGKLRLAHAPGALESVRARPLTIHLLAHGDGVEVIRQDVEAGALIGMRPEDGWTALEVFYVLTGRLRLQASGETFGPGDFISAHPVASTVLLEALEASSVLYVSSQPVFHLYSNDVQDLLKLAAEFEHRDGYTRDHCRRIQRMATAVGDALHLDSAQMYALSYGSYLHDVGKSQLPASLLGKPGPLSPEEWEVMKSHVTLGEAIVAAKSYLHPALPVVAQHHERLDGSGYPRGLAGEAIAVEARLVAVIDTFDAMTSARPYRPTPGVDAAVREIAKERGVTLDADVVDTFLYLLRSGSLMV